MPTCLTPVTTITNNNGSILVYGELGGSGKQNLVQKENNYNILDEEINLGSKSLTRIIVLIKK